MQPDKETIRIAEHFDISGTPADISDLGCGRINYTRILTYEDGKRTSKYTLQRINTDVFTDPAALMDNISRVTGHIRNRLMAEGLSDPDRHCLSLIPVHEGGPCHFEAPDSVWRIYRYIDNASTFNTCDSPSTAMEAGKAVGRFQNLLSDIPGAPLHETIKEFHNTPQRFKILINAVEEDVCNRSADAAKIIDDAILRKDNASALTDLEKEGSIPTRITHNDTKLNNVLIDNDTGEGLCLIDMDTIMPGLSLYDYGDLVRSSACNLDEDSCDTEHMAIDLDLFRGLTEGYLSSASEFLNKTEIEHLLPAARIITLELAIRFLTDHLNGDKYFKVYRQGQNLDRCRAQLSLLHSMETQEEQMYDIVQSIQSVSETYIA